MRTLVVLVSLASGSVASADGGYLEPHLIAGVRSVHGNLHGSSDERVDQNLAIAGFRATGGYHDDDATCTRRVGLFMEGFGPDFGFEAGIEVEIGWSISPGWRLGPRVTLGYAPYASGTHVGVGLNARYDVLSVGIDIQGGRANFGDANYGRDAYDVLVLSHVGISGKAAIYSVLGAAAISVIVGGVAVLVLPST